MDIQAFFRAVVEQNADALRSFFCAGAEIRWHNTNELFTVEEYIQANCQYPGQWEGELERVEPLASGSQATAPQEQSRAGGPTFNVAAFIPLEAGKGTGQIRTLILETGRSRLWKRKKSP